MAFFYKFAFLLSFSFATLANADAIKKTKPTVDHLSLLISSDVSSAAVTLNAKAFGFLPSASAAANTLALQKISAEINKRKGGVILIIDKGTYTVGRESFAGAAGKGFAYKNEPLLKIDSCTQPILIDGKGATIKFADGLHFGSFNAKTGAAHNAPGGGFYGRDYLAYPGSIIDMSLNKSVTIRNLVLDGNLQHQKLGGYWGDVGIQLPSDGIVATDNNELIIENVVCRYFGRDGIMVGNSTPDEKAPVKKIFLRNSTFNGNGRQGFSWIGGNHLIAFNCQFLNTGKTVNAFSGKTIYSPPGAGIDMEAERGLIRNGTFQNCLIDNNAGAGLLSVGNVADITYNEGKIIGATNWSIYGAGPRMLVQKTTIVGSPVNLRIGTGPNDPENAKFIDCLITLDSTLSPTKKVHGNYVMDFGGGGGGQFTNCTFDSKNRGSIYGGSGCVFTDCVFKQLPAAPGYNNYPFMTGNFYGVNKWYYIDYKYKYKLSEMAGLANGKFYGPFYINDVKVADKK